MTARKGHRNMITHLDDNREKKAGELAEGVAGLV